MYSVMKNWMIFEWTLIQASKIDISSSQIFARKPNAFDKLILNDENLSYVLLNVQFLACDNLPQILRQLAPRVGQVVSLKAQHKSLHISKTNRNILEILNSCKTYWYALPPEW